MCLWKLSLAVLAMALAAPYAVVHGAQGLAQDEQGWTVFAPSPDTRLLYVSSSLGDDETGRPHSPA